jgi:hypothetical protein
MMHAEVTNSSQDPLTSASTTSTSGAVLNINTAPARDAGGVVFQYDNTDISTNQGSYGAWIKTTVTTQQMIFQTGYGKPWIYIQNNQIGVLWDQAGDGWLSADTTPISDGNWHHIAVTFNNGAIAFYKDGVPTSDTLSVTTPQAAWPVMNISGNYGMQFTTPANYLILPGFVGSLWNVQIWSLGLAADAIFPLMSNTYVFDYPSGLQFLSSFDLTSGSATNLINGNVGTMSGPTIVSDTLPVAPTSPTAYTITYTTKLTEDFIHSNAMLASGTPALATFLNSSLQSEALLIHDTGELCHLMREPLSSTGWNIVGIGAQVANIVAASSSNLAFLGENEIWVSNAGHWNQLPALPADTETSPMLSALTDGTIYATSIQSGQPVLYQYDPGTTSMVEVGTVPYSTPPVGSIGNLWTIDDNQVFYCTDNPFNPQTSQWLSTNTEAFLNEGDIPQSVFITSDNTAWIYCNTLAVYSQSYNSQQWYELSMPPGLVISIAPLSASSLYALCQDISFMTTTLYTCDGNSNNTVVAQPTGRTLVSIALGALDGTLWALDSFGCVWNLRNGNWNRMIQPTDLKGATSGQQVTEVVTGQHALGSQYAFYTVGGILYWSVFQETAGVYGGYWTAPTPVLYGSEKDTPPVYASNIGVVNDPVTASNLIVYGVSPDGDLVVVQNGADGWSAAEPKKGTSLSGAKPNFNTCPGYWLTYSIVGGTMHANIGQLNDLQPSLIALEGSPQLTTMVPMATNPQGIYWTIGAIAIDTSGQLWTTQVVAQDGASFAWQFQSLGAPATTGGAKSAVAMLATATEGIRIYATDANDMLWVLRQTGYTAGQGVNSFQWSEWHPLGDVCMLLGTGCTMPPPSEANVPPVDLFSLDANSEVNVLSEEATTGALTDIVMLKPAGTNEDPEYVTRYVTEVTVSDQNSVQQRNFTLSVTANQTIGVWVGNVAYTVTPSTPVPMQTDNSGTLRFAFFATDLHTPTFSFSAEYLQSPPSIYPAQEVNDYLNGQSYALAGRPVFDSAGVTLSAAQKQTQPDWVAGAKVSFVPSTTPSGSIAPAAGYIRNIAAIKPDGNGAAGQWSVTSSAEASSGSSFWHDICKFEHDLERAIRNAVATVSSVVIDAENCLIQFTITIENLGSQLLQLAVHTVEDVVSAVKTVFRYIGCAVDDAIHWLKSLFDWSDVIYTKRVFEAGLSGLLDRIGGNLDKTSPHYISTLFDNFWTQDVIDAVQDAFNNAEQCFEPGQSVSAFTPSVPSSPAGGDALHPASVTSKQTSNGTQTNYVTSHIKTYSGNGGTYPSDTQTPGVSSGMTAAYTQHQSVANINQIGSTLQGLFSNLKDFADMVMLAVIEGLADAAIAILKVIEDIVNALIAAISDAFTAFNTMLTRQIDIPVISWIYKQISGGDPLTILDLACLIMAVPTTLVYKLTFGLPNAIAPFNQADVAAAQNAFGSGNFPWPVAAGGSGSSSGFPLGGAGVSGSSSGFPLGGAGACLMIFNAAVYAIFDLSNDLDAYNGFQDETPSSAPDAYAKFMGVTSIVCTLISQWLSAPYNIFSEQSTTAEQWTIGLWGANFIPVLSGILFLIDDLKLWQYSYLGVGVACFTGISLFAIGVATAVEQHKDTSNNGGPKYNGLYQAQSCIAALSTALKPLVTVVGQYEQPAGAAAMGILGVVDIGIDTASGILSFCEDL